MSDLKALTGRGYLSFSSLSAYADCSERFMLERIAKVPTAMGWWLPAGTALHYATELLDTGQVLTAEAAWELAWAKALRDLDGVMPTKAAGRVTKEFPNKEDKSYWDAKGAELVAKYVTWRDLKFSTGWQWLTINDAPAVEVAVQAEFNGTPVLGYIDRVMVSPTGEVYILDLKSSSREPTSIQMEVYRWLLKHTHGIDSSYAQYYLFRKGSTSEAKPLRLSEQWIGHYFTTARRGIESNVYLPNLGMLCGTCGVRDYCSVFGTPPVDIEDHEDLPTGA